MYTKIAISAVTRKTRHSTVSISQSVINTARPSVTVPSTEIAMMALAL